jgi:hypothetical protein
MTLFGNQSFRVGLVVSLVFFAGIPAFFFTFGLYLQIGLGFSALHAGLTGFPFALGTAIASSQSDKLAQRLGTNVLRLGAGLLSLSMVVLIWVVHHFGTGITSWDIAPFLLFSGLGLGCFIAPLTNLILAGIQGREAGSASGVLTTGQQVGGALGIAIVGLVFFGLLSGHAPQAAAAASSRLPAVVPAATFEHCFVEQSRSKDPQVTPADCPRPESFPAALREPVLKAAAYGRRVEFVYAFERTLLYEVGVFALAALLVSFLPQTKPTGHAGPPGGE